jgi:hypoxanthine phosphoribosyltransferase
MLFLFLVLKIVDMQKITLKDKTFRPFITYDKISASIDKVAEQINKDFEGCTDVPVLLCVLNGSIMFMAELMQRINFNCQIISTKLSSYEGTETTGKVKQAMGLTADLTGRRVIIVEDIVDTGNTIVELKRILEEAGAAESRICTMLLKPDAYKKDIPLDYVAMEIPNDFIIGFGLDYDELGRNYKDIYILDK